MLTFHEHSFAYVQAPADANMLNPFPEPEEVVFPLFCDRDETEYEMTAGQANYKSFDTCFRGLCPAFLGLFLQNGLGKIFFSPAVAAPALLAPPK